MYAYLKGKIEKISNDNIILDVNNVGYEIYMPESEIGKLNDKEEIRIYTYLHVREDEMRLFGFIASETLEFFKKLISVSGVGPKVALGIISNISPGDMCVAIATDNIVALKAIPGIGPKMAQKIIFELKDKVIKDGIVNSMNKVSSKAIQNPNINDAITALEVLGYNSKYIKEVISNLDVATESVEEIIKKVLKEMQKI